MKIANYAKAYYAPFKNLKAKQILHYSVDLVQPLSRKIKRFFLLH
nr:MAG TPA: hypothetical protein [Caudoviricetes sp.]